jgi:diaminohydroxyphosphoribosylaminopyrimidine deaminase/5-amino-6-(5-phosphoribosylamino)uracil reductase
VTALAEAGPAAREGTLVVTLEPCASTGRTGPCTTALLDAGVARVVYAIDDPTSTGADVLRAVGVSVAGGVLADDARPGLAVWLAAAETGRPLVTWKFASTLDGRTAAADTTSQWITGPAARADAHDWRARHDAVLVGIGTVLADDPTLTPRLGTIHAPPPLRVVADPDGRTPAHARVLAGGATLLAVAPGVRAPAGADTVEVPRTAAGLDLGVLLGELYRRGVRSVLVEGGARLAASFVRAGYVDRAIGYLGPLLLGAGRPVLDDVGVGTIDAARPWQIEDVTVLAGDVRIIARPVREG